MIALDPKIGGKEKGQVLEELFASNLKLSMDASI
jgi:hypothetical protein